MGAGDAGSTRSGADGVIRSGADGLIRSDADGVIRSGADGVIRSGADGLIRSDADGVLPPLYDGPVAVRALDDVVAAIMARPARTGVRIVGVDGPSGSGKSTLARRLAARVEGAVIVKIDDFVAWDDLTEWWPRFDAQVLAPLLAGRTARYQVRDWIHDEFGRSVRGWKTARPAPLILLEGVTCTRAAAVHALTYAIWVEAPHPVRVERGLRRDGEDHLDVWRRWFAMERAFFVPDGTARRADLRVLTASALAHDPDRQVVVADRPGVGLPAGPASRSRPARRPADVTDLRGRPLASSG